jgi:hypothetical protein
VSVTADGLMDMIAERWGPLRSGRKMLARTAGVSPRTAENWLQRKNAPQVEQVFALMQNDPEFGQRLLDALADTVRR